MTSPQPGHDPNALLTQAIEKLLYLESRLESSEAANDSLARERDRHRSAARDARRALTEWQRRAVHAEVAAEGAEREVSVLRSTLGEARDQLRQAPDDRELTERLQDTEEALARLQSERESWLDRMITVGQLRGDEDALDLGGFIAELRAELIALRRGEKRAPATIARLPRKPDPRALVEAAPVPVIELDLLVKELRLPRAEKTLASLCARELVDGMSGQRRRSADRLREAGIAAFNPWVAQRLAVESDPGVREAYVRLLDATGGDSMGVVMERALTDVDPRVRAAALEGLARRDGPGSAAALHDTSPAIRRRALARLPRNGAALDQLSDALRDDDPGVRRVAITVLAGRTGSEAEALLRAAATLPDDEVAAIAKAALEARGLPLEVISEPPAEETPAPAEVTPAAVEARAEPLDDDVETPVDALPPVPEDAPEPTRETGPFDPPATTVAPEVAVSPAVSAPEVTRRPPATQALINDDWEDDPDATAVLDEVRRALRGRTIEELVELAGVDARAATDAADRLVAAGVLVWRGRKLWPA